MTTGGGLTWSRLQMQTWHGPVHVFIGASKDRQELLDFVDAEGIASIHGEVWMSQRIRASLAVWDDASQGWTTNFTDPMPDVLPMWELSVLFKDDAEAMQFQLAHLEF